ncbi:hypothetical protein, partial [Streptomyces albidoflavus]|uniref:hypothetical protein n=1 Tax=Streptomyces albidoflavus TaxID=1886 RepID=UPI001C536B2F
RPRPLLLPRVRIGRHRRLLTRARTALAVRVVPVALLLSGVGATPVPDLERPPQCRTPPPRPTPGPDAYSTG